MAHHRLLERPRRSRVKCLRTFPASGVSLIPLLTIVLLLCSAFEPGGGGSVDQTDGKDSNGTVLDLGHESERYQLNVSRSKAYLSMITERK